MVAEPREGPKGTGGHPGVSSGLTPCWNASGRAIVSFP